MDTPAKQQVAERVKQANNILVTVSSDPSVDQLAAAIGLTLLLNKMGKHATAVFSGKVPSTIEFLQPEKTLEVNTDSLRDFIISLDKSKADKLRYKVEDQVVRIFITPYKTSLSDKDLVFSQGDFNVEVVMALGVHDRTQLDAAITAHGRILHDATVVSVNTDQGSSQGLGQINWLDPNASSLSEMIVSISEAFGPGLIDNQMATAFLTGIVAETDRFSNAKTSPKVMTMSAQLMAAGANQQLIVSKLAPPPPPPPPKPLPPPPKPPKKKGPLGQLARPTEAKGTLNVSHQPAKMDSPEVEVEPNEIHIDEQGNLKTAAELGAEIQRLEKIKAEKEHEEDGSKVLPVQVPPVPVTPEPIQSEPILPPVPPLPMPAPLLPSPVMPPVPQTPPMPIPPPPIPLSPPASMSLPPVPQPPMPQTQINNLPSQHALLNPLDHKPAMTAPFTANTSDENKPGWATDSYSTPIDPINSGPQSPSDGIYGHAKSVQPPVPHTSPLDTLLGRGAETYSPAPAPILSSTSPPPANPLSVDNARMAVESAMTSQPFDNAHPEPIAALGAQPMGPDLHAQPPAPPNGNTPSLSLPSNGSGTQAPYNFPPVAPPPLPPPLPPTGYPQQPSG